MGRFEGSLTGLAKERKLRRECEMEPQGHQLLLLDQWYIDIEGVLQVMSESRVGG